jgi:4-amino-4-deoxy-L-arabinose transferase-like glycosyltransferase
MNPFIAFCSLPHAWLCAVSITLAIIACLFLRHRNAFWTPFFLFLAALFVRLFMAWQDPFLHEWDERFHALVARNMMHDPFMPLLRRYPLMGYDPFSWANCYVWLHKQPLFLWQMALSMKIFGVSEFAIRYPAVLMGALMVVFVYSIAMQLSRDKYTAFAAALFFCYCNFHLEITSGFKGMDQNDVAFGFYVLASIWAYSKYTTSQSMKYALLVGLFAGCAVLNKWLTGLMVFSGWGASILLLVPPPARKAQLVHMAMAIGVALLVFMPWQLYILHAFPVEAAFEYSYNARHISEVIEGHDGNNMTYVNIFDHYFGEVGWLLVPFGFMLLLLRREISGKIRSQLQLALLTIFATVFIFFSYIVRTKIEAYFLVVAPIGCIFMAVAIIAIARYFFRFGKLYGKIVKVIAIIVCAFSIFNPEKIVAFHRPSDPHRIEQAAYTRVYKRISKLPANTSLIINLPTLEDYSAMFYNSDKAAYAGMTWWHIRDSVIDAGGAVAVFMKDGEQLPPDLVARPRVYVVSPAY